MRKKKVCFHWFHSCIASLPFFRTLSFRFAKYIQTTKKWSRFLHERKSILCYQCFFARDYLWFLNADFRCSDEQTCTRGETKATQDFQSPISNVATRRLAHVVKQQFRHYTSINPVNTCEFNYTQDLGGKHLQPALPHHCQTRICPTYMQEIVPSGGSAYVVHARLHCRKGLYTW